jgi:hypothetical protein
MLSVDNEGVVVNARFEGDDDGPDSRLRGRQTVGRLPAREVARQRDLSSGGSFQAELD